MKSIARGIRSRPTASLAIACAILLVGVIVTAMIFTSTTRSLTSEDVTAEVTTGMDELTKQLPGDAVVDVTDATRFEPCPDGSAGQLTGIDRSIETTPGFDTVQWMRQLSEKYSSTEGWSATIEPIGSTDRLTLTLANRALMLFTIRSPTVEHPELITMTATSRCSRE